MRLHFAAAAILLASVPAYAQPQQDCFNAAAQASADHAQDGIAACTLALANDSTARMRAGTLVNRGIIEAAARRDDAAIVDFTAALSNDAGLSSAYMGRGLVMLRTTRYDEARADFTQAIELGVPNLHVAYFNRGEAEEAAGSVTAAYHDYRKAQELAPDFQPAAEELSRCTVVHHGAGRIG